MSYRDFDVESLAQYLHLTTAQVQRMSDRGKLPGRKIAGEWRFSQADIHHWLEDRIGLSDEEELADVEGTLRRAHGVTAEPLPSIVELLPVEAIAVPLAARTRGSVTTEMVELAAHTGWLWDTSQMADAVRLRESLHPTALDNGVALLHPRRPLSTILAQPFLAFGRTHQGLPFGHPRGTLTDLFFLICSTDDRTHLRVLARLSRLVSSANLLTALRDAASPRDVRETIRRFENELPE